METIEVSTWKPSKNSTLVVTKPNAFHIFFISCMYNSKKGKGCLYSITKRSVPELIPVLDSQPAGDVSHKPGGRLPLLSARPSVTPTTLKRAAINFAAL